MHEMATKQRDMLEEAAFVSVSTALSCLDRKWEHERRLNDLKLLGATPKRESDRGGSRNRGDGASRISYQAGRGWKRVQPTGSTQLEAAILHLDQLQLDVRKDERRL